MKEGGHFEEKITVFEKLLDAVIIEKISPEVYCRKYLGHLLDHRKYYLTIYADVLEKLISHSEKKATEIAMIDFGAGNGLLGIFAKYCGFKNVFINDIDKKFVDASRNLAMQMQVMIDGYIPGDIHNVQSFFKNEMPDAILGTDVIEHIYSLEDFFSTIKKINPSMASVFTTASNPKNYFKTRQLKKLHLKDEYEGGTPDDFILFGDSALEPFFKTRQNIIYAQLGSTDEATILKLAKATRGMNEADILAVIKNYKINGMIPLPPIHPTNTCNPLNGSWTERILKMEEYISIYNSNGMKLELYNGFYDEHKTGLKKILNKTLNMAVLSLGSTFAPYIIFVGSKK
ncbi:MAG: methyltransferase domain-containing protein [Ferruginibacter sp.]